MIVTAADDLAIRYEGPGEGTEIIAATQANFLLARPGMVAREAAVLLNNPAAALLAAETGSNNDADFRRRAANVAGAVALRRHYQRTGRTEPVLVISKATLREDPDLFDEVRRAVVSEA